MAAKKKAMRKPAGKRPDIHTLSTKASEELQKLRDREDAGTITGRELKTGLREINRDLKLLSIWIHFICN